jgi:hypothetical protein
VHRILSVLLKTAGKTADEDVSAAPEKRSTPGAMRWNAVNQLVDTLRSCRAEKGGRKRL